MLNLYTGPSKDRWQMPASFVDAFCRVTGDDSLKRFLLGPQLSRLLVLGEKVAEALPKLLTEEQRAHKRDAEPEIEELPVAG